MGIVVSNYICGNLSCCNRKVINRECPQRTGDCPGSLSTDLASWYVREEDNK